MRLMIYLFLLLAVPALLLSSAAAQAPPMDDAGQALVTVDWFEEMLQGGFTMVALAAMSVALLVFIIERAIRLRASRLAPRDLADQLIKLARAGRFDEALAVAEKDPSVLAEVGAFVISHRHVDAQLTMAGAGDLAARAIDAELERAYPLAIIAALAPLLGLLGTMIGMIEAFKLVEVFGDEGGASLLAGSISKALITTAVGLILAIPALICYHIFRHRVNLLAAHLERSADAVFQACYFKPAGGATPKPVAAPASKPQPEMVRSRSSAADRPRSATPRPNNPGPNDAPEKTKKSS